MKIALCVPLKRRKTAGKFSPCHTWLALSESLSDNISSFSSWASFLLFFSKYRFLFMLTKAYNSREFMFYPSVLIIVNRKHRATFSVEEVEGERNFCIFGSIKDIYERSFERIDGDGMIPAMIVTAELQKFQFSWNCLCL
jgi:hypothetical protein